MLIEFITTKPVQSSNAFLFFMNGSFSLVMIPITIGMLNKSFEKYSY
ncbi:MAG: hypothetical protein H7296_09665 [Bacteroidia bacterium]|nr:hypothetical protein [Bacteroidia bacterium]